MTMAVGVAQAIGGGKKNAGRHFYSLSSRAFGYHFSMDKSVPSAELLFSYGTLRDEAVQLANFGRLLTGRAASLPGYTLASIMIDDPSVVALSGKSKHMIARRSEKPEAPVPGMVFEITPDELAAADRYEVSQYTRVRVRLTSGERAWVYVGS